jgi:hypothetical protein
MSRFNRIKDLFLGSANPLTNDRVFENYYGTLLSSNQEGGPNAQEARRDFEHIRTSINRCSIF